MEDLSQRPTYSKSQVSQYFHHISLPERYQKRAFEITSSKSSEDQLDFLTSLQQHQLANVPFENLAIHYSPHHTVSLDPDTLYAKIVGNDRGRGGYCMENNCFFGTVLRTLGFQPCSVGCRVADAVNGSPGGGYGGWSHMINLITLPNGKTYMLDVGFGSDGPTRPLPLENSLETGSTQPGIGTQQLRLIHDNIAPNTDPNQRLWIFQRRHSEPDEWGTAYCFTELEFLPKDYELMNFYTSQSRTTFFTYAIIVVKYIMEEQGEQLAGQVILSGAEVKRRMIGRETEKLMTCTSEVERVDALERWFGVRLTAEERRGINGLVTQLKG